jgi:hypothetical protein
LEDSPFGGPVDPSDDQQLGKEHTGPGRIASSVDGGDELAR